MGFESLYGAEPEADPKTKKSRYGKAERVIALICFALGYMIMRSFADAGLGASVTVAAMTAASAVYMNRKGAVQRLPHYLYLIFVASFSSVYVLSDDVFIKSLATLFIFGALLFYPYFTSGSGRREFINDMFVFDMIKSVFIMPYPSSVGIFPAAFSCGRTKKSGFRFWHIAAGLAAAFVPTVAVALLLCFADAGFTSVMRSGLDYLSGNVFNEVFRFISGIPAAMFIFGSLFANAAGKHKEVLNRDQHGRFLSAVSAVPGAAAYAAVTPLCILYVIFLSVQAKYYFGGFASNLPDGLTYAEYARSGFFELCAVAVINMGLIIVLSVFTKKKDNGKSALPLKIYSVIMSCFTLLLIAVAMSKMIMYINAYGLSRQRIFTSWFMILLAFAFIFVIIKQFMRKFNYFGALAAVFAVLFGVLCFCDVDARIAEYNVGAYITDSKKTIDMDQLQSLSDSALPYILKLTEPVEGRSDEENEAVTGRAKEILSSRKRACAGGYDVIGFNVPRYRAQKISEPF